MPSTQTTTYDAIVIGSGIGGMTAAGLLAGVAGKRVLVLEKHIEPGGLTHVFRRDGAAWDVGLHYVGEVAPGSQARAYLDFLSGRALRWNRMTDVFERFVYPGLNFAVPSDPQAYKRKLIDTFPDEAYGIRRYFRDIRRAVRWTTLGFMCGMVPRPVEPVLRAIQRLTGHTAKGTTKAYLDANFRSLKLRALLASQWGDYGLTPARSAFAIHAQIVSHYLDGAWFPEGGAGRIARTFETGIERAGGSIRVAQEVTSIVIEAGRAVGVNVMDRRGPTPEERGYRAPIVISNTGAPITFRNLLRADGEVGEKTSDVRALIDRLGSGLSAVTLYLRLKTDARTIGVKGENFWINSHFDHDDIAAQTKGLMAGTPRSVYVSFPSIKAGDARFHTAEIIAFVEIQAFAPWRDRPKGNRGADYSALKQCIGEGLLRLAETAIPGLTALVEYSELSTPLTVEHYTSHPVGAFYGLPASPERYRSPLLGPRTPIEGLYLSGSDAGCIGILGAMMGGVGAACQALGFKGFPMIQAALKKGPKQVTETSRPPEKQVATLTVKRQLTPTIWHLEFQVEGAVERYAPGQFARLHVGGDEWRDYSIAGLQGNIVQFLISTRTGGRGSLFAQRTAIGAQSEIELPLGQYRLVPSTRRKVFIATGTGLAPFIPMLQELARSQSLSHTTLFFGSKTIADDITTLLDTKPGTIVHCISREAAPPGGFSGRVTQALELYEFDPDSTDFYLCGSAAMVADCKAVLESREAKNLWVESF